LIPFSLLSPATASFTPHFGLQSTQISRYPPFQEKSLPDRSPFARLSMIDVLLLIPRYDSSSFQFLKCEVIVDPLHLVFFPSASCRKGSFLPRLLTTVFPFAVFYPPSCCREFQPFPSSGSKESQVNSSIRSTLPGFHWIVPTFP